MINNISSKSSSKNSNVYRDTVTDWWKMQEASMQSRDWRDRSMLVSLSFRNTKIHSSQTRPICLHSNQLKEIWSCSSPWSYLIPLADWVQAWPMPLTGAGPIQNLHQVGADETAVSCTWKSSIRFKLQRQSEKLKNNKIGLLRQMQVY